MRRTALAWVVVLALGCGDDESTSAAGDTGNDGGNGGNGSADSSGGDGQRPNSDATGEAPAPGPSAEGWQSVYAEQGVGINCDQSMQQMLDAGAPHLEIEGTTLVIGFEQIGDNQDPIVARFDGGERVYCRYHETEPPDGRAVGLTWDGGEMAYLVHTIVGGGSSLEGKGGWAPSYAPGAISGGGPKVSYVGRFGVSDGELLSGTFVLAVKMDNSVNSHKPRGPVTVLEDGTVEFLGESAHKPIDEGMVSMDCTDYPFDSKYVFSEDLGSLVCAECSNCTSKSPCG